MRIYVELAREVARMQTLEEKGDLPLAKATDIETDLHKFVKDKFPSGSGFDSGTQLLTEESTGNKLVFQADFHHMDENGSYDGWSMHKVYVRPCLQFGFRLTITGSNRNEIKDYIHDCFEPILNTEIPDYSVSPVHQRLQ